MKNANFVVLLGLDAEQKAHAARFGIVDEAAVRKAAGLMGFRIGQVKSAEAKELAAKLPEGKIFETGRGLAPYVREDIYAKLVQKLELEPETKAAESVAQDVKPTASTDPWAQIKVGSIVLCRDSVPHPSWWECTVVSVAKDSQALSVRWTNYPTFKPFSVKRAAVALPPPKAR